MSNTQESVSTAVSELINQIYSRETSVKQKICDLEAKALTEKAIITQLKRSLVDADMVGTEKDQAAINKELITHRAIFDGLDEKNRMYRDSLNDKEFIRSGLANVFEVAQKAKEDRKADLLAKNTEIEQIDKQVTELLEKRDAIASTTRFSYMKDGVDERAILHILKHVETRPISHNDELAFLQAFATGASREELEQRFVVGIKQEKTWVPPQQVHTTVELIQQPVNRTEGKVTTFSPFGSPDFVAQARKGSI